MKTSGREDKRGKERERGRKGGREGGREERERREKEDSCNCEQHKLELMAPCFAYH